MNPYSCGPSPWSPPHNSCFGCLQQYDAACVFYKGSTLSCTGMTTGKTLDVILQALDTKICSISNPSAYASSSVTGTLNQIVVTPSVIGNNTNYNVALSASVLLQITNNTNSIAAIISSLGNYITSITSSTLTITHTGSVYNIEYNPVTTNYNGVTYFDGSTHDNSGPGTLINVNQDFVTRSAITTGDQIIFKIAGQFTGSNFPNNPTIFIDINSTFGTLFEISNSPQNPSGNAFYVEISLFVSSPVSAIVNAFWYVTQGSGIASSPILSPPATSGSVGNLLSWPLAGIDFTNFIVGIRQAQGFGIPGQNKITLFTSSVVKKY